MIIYTRAKDANVCIILITVFVQIYVKFVD